MSPEKQLLDALQRLAKDRHVELDFGPTSDLVVPLAGGNELRLPMIFLTTIPDAGGVGDNLPGMSSGVADPVWPHPAGWDKPDD
jgi:hypothetical protein